MKLRTVISALVFLAFFTIASPLPAQDARAIATRTISVIGGNEWEKTRYIAFTFGVERGGVLVASYRQRWDRYTGEYSVAGKDREGHEYSVRMNVNTRKGSAVVDGVASTDPKWLETGYRRFINDTYWLLMPLKMLDPGVNLDYDGEQKDAAGEVFDVLRLSFGNGVGLTPKDQYWPWINRDTGLVEKWVMLLEDHEADEKPSPVIFHAWERFGGVLISTRRENASGSYIVFNDITFSDTVPPGAL